MALSASHSLWELVAAAILNTSKRAYNYALNVDRPIVIVQLPPLVCQLDASVTYNFPNGPHIKTKHNNSIENMLFCLRSDDHYSRYTGALCGLGMNEHNVSLFPANDMEITFDVEFTEEDLQNVCYSNIVSVLISVILNDKCIVCIKKHFIVH